MRREIRSNTGPVVRGYMLMNNFTLTVMLIDVAILTFAPLVSRLFPGLDPDLMYVWLGALIVGFTFTFFAVARALWRCRRCLMREL